MGLKSSKIAINSLTNQKLGRISRKKILLKPQLCAAIFNRTSGFCQNQDILELKNFLKSDANVCKSVKNQDNKEILKALKTRQMKKMSTKTEAHLFTLCKTLESAPNKPKLLTKIILPVLETIYAENKALEESKNSVWKSMKHFIYSLFFVKISPKIIRKEPKLKSLSGIDRAHIFSLSLATDLWQLIYGDKFITQKEKKCLRTVLRSEANLCYTCKFTNRVTHVKYDHEILQALLYHPAAGSPPPRLSFGAKSRVKDILKSLQIIEKTATNNSKIRHFLRSSRGKLETIL